MTDGRTDGQNCHNNSVCLLETVNYLSATNFDVEIVSFVRNFKNLWPRESVDSKFVAIDQQPSGTYSNHDFNAFLVLNNSYYNS